ncbi:MAG TPA: hypothetical protein VFX42_08285 [Gemmatimonadales bacterium]|nr:hypothetical protein [Gemmatimonadales bacterium]
MRGLFLLLVIAAALLGASYAGARFTVGKLVGPEPGLGPSTTHFAFQGIPGLKNHPRGWVVAYPAARDFGPRGAEVYISPTGQLLGSRPGDLARRVEEARKSREEP